MVRTRRLLGAAVSLSILNVLGVFVWKGVRLPQDAFAGIDPIALVRHYNCVVGTINSSSATLRGSSKLKDKDSKFDIVCLTMNRPDSLKRLLTSLEDAEYEHDTVRLVIRLDVNATNHVDAATKQVAEDFQFTHGPKEIIVASAHQGLRSAWLNAWKPGSSKRHAIILEDDLEVSPAWYKYVKKAWSTYDEDSSIAGISLNRQQLIADEKFRSKEIVNSHRPFLYKLVGSQGFSPNPIVWNQFLTWIDTLDLDTFQANVPGLLTSVWYKTLKKTTMWTQLFIYFCNEHDLYTLYVNLPQKKTLVAHWQEKGEHYAFTRGRDFELSTTVDLDLPIEPARYGWDGIQVQQQKETKLPPAVTPKLSHAGTKYGGWTYDTSTLNKDSIVYSVGLGEDTSWDEEVLERHKVNVWGFDPTPKSLLYVKERKELKTSRFHLIPEGLSTSKHLATFTMPKNPDYVSMREGEHDDMGSKVAVPVNTLENWMKANGHTRLDILKMDIEGSEYDVIEDWIKRDYFPMDQLLVEWHFRWLKDKSRHNRVLTGLKERGWYIARSQNNGQEMTFLRSTPSTGKTISKNGNAEETNAVGDSESKKPDNNAEQRLINAAKAIADKYGVVLIQMLNEGFIEITKSWICNVRIFEDVLEKTVFIVTDQASFAAISTFDKSLNVVHVPYDAPKDMQYGQYAYYNFMLFRTKLLYHLLQEKITLWLVEADAVWLDNPTETIMSTQGDIVTMSDRRPPSKILQGGFQLLRPTPPTIIAWTKLVNGFVQRMRKAKAGHRHQMGDSGSEQLLLGDIIRKEPGLSVAWLPYEHFAPGEYYKDLAAGRNTTHPKVILNNYIVGNAKKVERAKKWGHWFLTDDSVCIEQASNKLLSHTTGIETALQSFSCSEPHSLPDGGDCQALELDLRPDWACFSEMRASIPTFVELYEQRPIKDNEGGMRFDHSFALWYILRHVQPRPEVVIESGTFRGHATWIIKQALPNARVISLDPRRRFIRGLRGVEYMIGNDFVDVAEVDWKGKGVDPQKAIVFLDDHQSGYKRIFLELKKQGFFRFMLDDNYPYSKGDNMSLKWTCEVERESLWPSTVPDNFGRHKIPLTWSQHMKQANYLEKALMAYYEFPPVASSELSQQTRFDPRYTSTPIVTDDTFFTDHLSSLKKDEFGSYTHFAYVEIDLDAGEAPGFEAVSGTGRRVRSTSHRHK